MSSLFNINSESENNIKENQKRTLATVTKERGQVLNGPDVDKLTSPGNYKFTVDDSKVSGSNTRFIFKNLYGETPLTFLFFSDKNFENIQNILKHEVYKKTGYTIDKQSLTELIIVMRSIFLEYSLHPKLIDEDTPTEIRLNLYKEYTNEVKRLNKIAVDEILPKIISQIQQYVGYLQDVNKAPYHMETPKNHSTAGMKQYRSPTQVLFGGDF